MPAPELNAAQSAARIRELEAKGYEVVRETQPNGDVVVYTRAPGASNAAWLLVLLGLGGCFLFAKSRGGR